MRFPVFHAVSFKHLSAAALAASWLLAAPLAGATTASGGPPEPDAGFGGTGGTGGTGGGSTDTGGAGGSGGSRPSESSGCALAASGADGTAWGVALAAALALAAQRRRVKSSRAR